MPLKLLSLRYSLNGGTDSIQPNHGTDIIDPFERGIKHSIRMKVAPIFNML